MALKPGILTEWPWKSLGNFKYLLLGPFVTHSIYSFMVKEEKERDLVNFIIFPSILARMLHNQLWISYSRYRTAKGNNRILDKTIDFDQVDRESNWDDQVLMHGLVFYGVNLGIPGASHVPMWRTDGAVLAILLHAGPVEFLYYWFHRALHHHYLYTRYHSHHHSSIVTQPITAVVHPFAEIVVYFILFAIPLIGVVLTGTASLVVIFGYVFYIDFMNNLGHCNFEIIPKSLFSVLPPLKYLFYTASFHSLHHTKFRTNYSLFMPFYDYIYDTMDKTSDEVHETALKKPADSPTHVHLTHFTTLDSVYHFRLGFTSLASAPQTSAWFLWILSPFTYFFMLLTSLFGSTFVAERNTLNNQLRSQTWLIPRYKIQYFLKWQRAVINYFVEEAILEADRRGTKVLSLGLLNQGEELNRCGELYIEKYPKLKVKLVDGSSLAAAIILNNIPKGTTRVLLRGNITKVAKAVALALHERGIQVAVFRENESKIPRLDNYAVVTTSYDHKVWLIGEGLTDKEQLKAPEGTVFIPMTQFPPKRLRKDCFYHNTPAMLAPSSLCNLDSCEDWLPRRAMSACRVAGIVHTLEDWKVNECGDTLFCMDKVWQASLRHGFLPLSTAR
ncbi:very-long-chain aldehyde decarbonylase CER1 [Manihot esculenta]|uniref:Fatty acid hydroxylase domain-containing protein n=1 Tax=Manihot esculenta TaxID=3983 RepID=A0A2C9VTR5_MANES|nr:very-long-chain aldehyde decarbonylase CER1 [Manihot esculenta]OAY49483.1 hypothetical protein MANES_05G059800v8 [Manihot esculenta]